jgi:hypothetical protein
MVDGMGVKTGANWLAWTLHFIAGFVAAGFVALVLTRGGWQTYRGMPLNQLLLLVVGAALAGPGLATYYGDRLWNGLSYNVIPPDEVQQSRLSRFLSCAVGALGGGLILLALLLRVGLL